MKTLTNLKFFKIISKTTSIILAFHICAGEDELQIFSFLCPNGTLFNQQYFVCDWWFNVDCDKTEEFYSLNEELDNARQDAASQDNYQSDILKVGLHVNPSFDGSCECLI